MSDKMNDISKEEQYLKHVLELINIKQAEIDAKVLITDQDMADFHDYFWNSYTEFDEYGYELFDNTNAIRQKIVQKGDYIKEKYTYERMKDSPYFGRVDFIYEFETEPVACYIGISNLSENIAELPLVYDWRAPISSLFYDYDSGAACYEAPAGVINGVITDKYQYKISGGRILYMLQSDINIDDEILKKELGTHASASLKAIVSTIQKEQNRIIRDTEHRILAVQGCAGSGKTSVALHRIAYLLYHKRNTLNASQILILSPNGVFSDYISRILPELGEENICEMSLDIWAYHRLRKEGDTQDRYDAIEEKLDSARHHIYATSESDYKQSQDFVRELDGFVLDLESDLIDIRDFKYRGNTYSADYIANLFYDKLWNQPILERMNSVAEFIIDEEETKRNKDMSGEEKQLITDALNAMYRTKDIVELYNEFLESTGRDKLKAYRTGVTDEPEDVEENSYDDWADNPLKEARREFAEFRKNNGWLRIPVIPYEDVYPLLYLKYSIQKNENERPVKHLIIDEMQDYTYLQYRLIEKLFPCDMTILGDKAQTMEEKQRDVLEFLPGIFGKDLYRVELNKSYRSTKEITEYAASLVGADTVSSIDRHGNSVETYYAEDFEERVYQISSKLTDIFEDSDTIAVITINAYEAKRVYDSIKGMVQEIIPQAEVNLLTADTSSFKTGISVAPFYLTKGLEFDAVCIVDDPTYNEAMYKQALYIEATRALHELHVFKLK